MEVISPEAVSNVRALFEKELTANPDAYHPVDIERVRTEEWQVKRFLLDQPDRDEDKALQSLCKSLQWKKSFGVHERTDQYFPKEFWELNGVEIYGKDSEGRLVQWEAIRNQRTFKETALMARQFVAHCMERIDRLGGETGFILVTNSNGGGISNVDMELSKFKIEIVDYYPIGLKAMYVVDLPWLLNAIMKIIVSLMSDKLSQLVHNVNGSELSRVIDAQFIPVELKGGRDKHAFPNDLVPMDQLGDKLNLDEKFIDSYYKYFKLKRTNKP